MTIEEIFSKLAEHMLEGIMFHEQVANCYGFLTLPGYKKCHEYHYYCEIRNYRHLYNYVLSHCNKLIKVNIVPAEDIINSSFYKYTRQEIDINTKRTTVRDIIKKWVTWEEETKGLLEACYKELYEAGEVAACFKIGCFIKDVEKELKCAVNKQIKLEATGYDIGSIVGEQDELHDKYKCKLDCLKL